MRCDECEQEGIAAQDLAYDKEKNFMLCRACYVNHYMGKMGKILMKIPGAKEHLIIQAASAMFDQQRRLNPPPNTQQTDMAGTPPQPAL